MYKVMFIIFIDFQIIHSTNMAILYDNTISNNLGTRATITSLNTSI